MIFYSTHFMLLESIALTNWHISWAQFHTFRHRWSELHHVPKLATLLQISWCKIINTWQIFTKCKTLVETIILN